MVRRIQVAAAIALAALALGCATACTGDAPTPRPVATTTPKGSGYFVGRSPEGVGAAVDLQAHDRITERAAEALLDLPEPAGRPAVTVGVASVVNDGGLPVPLPRFIAVMDGGGAVPLLPARTAGLGIPGAREIFPTPPLFVPADGAATVHLVLRNVHPAEVHAVKMVVRAGEPVVLSAHRR